MPVGVEEKQQQSLRKKKLFSFVPFWAISIRIICLKLNTVKPQ